jgi:hypothetical protein
MRNWRRTRAFGAQLHYRERSRDLKLIPWLDALASDVVFGWPPSLPLCEPCGSIRHGRYEVSEYA